MLYYILLCFFRYIKNFNGLILREGLILRIFFNLLRLHTHKCTKKFCSIRDRTATDCKLLRRIPFHDLAQNEICRRLNGPANDNWILRTPRCRLSILERH